MAIDYLKYAPKQAAGDYKKYAPKPTGSDPLKYAPKGISLGPPDLATSNGLYNLAEQSGLKNQADSVLSSQTGEKTKQIFSGGFISDSFDVLSALQYGTVGLLKGKSFLEGVKTRASFTDKDALGDKGLPGVIAGIALDIAFDPLTYIAPETIVSKVPFLSAALKGTKEAVFGKLVAKTIQTAGEGDKVYQAIDGGTKAGKYLASKFAWMFGADPIFKETYQRSIKNIGVETENIVKMAQDVAKLEPQTASKLLTKDGTGRFMRTPLSKLDLTPQELDPVIGLYKKIDDLGAQAVDLGLLSKDKFEENVGEYIKNAYTQYEEANKKGLFGAAKVGIKGIKNRVAGLTEEGMKELGQIDNPAYLLFKSAFDLTKDVENAKLFQAVSKGFGTDIAQAGFTKLPDGKRLGELAGKYVPDNIANYLTDIITPSEKTFTKSLIASFKFNKVIMNPATHARNIISNKVLNYWKLGMNPLSPHTLAAEAESLAEIAKGTGKWTEEARPLGYNLNTFASAEGKAILDGPATELWGKGVSLWDKTKKRLGDIYQAEENQSKLAAYIYQRKNGILPEEAWKAAESATFNYSQVTPFVRKMREAIYGFPFITFTVKSTPAVIETAYKNPNRISVIGKIKQGIEELSDNKLTERERAAEPAWVKNGFYLKLPMKDKEGRSAYFDLTYILPFGDLLSGNFLERGTNRDTGTPENQGTALLKKSPMIQTAFELGHNQDFYGNKIWKDSDSREKQLGDMMRHLSKSYLPPLIGDQIPGGYNEKGQRQQRGIPGALKPQVRPDQQRTLMEEMMRYVGAKVQPMDADIAETYQEWNKRKALETLLKESGVGSSFEKFYIPKKQ